LRGESIIHKNDKIDSRIFRSNFREYWPGMREETSGLEVSAVRIGLQAAWGMGLICLDSSELGVSPSFVQISGNSNNFF
jgi:hypothetical protein